MLECHNETVCMQSCKYVPCFHRSRLVSLFPSVALQLTAVRKRFRVMPSMKPMEQATELMTKLTDKHKCLADKMSMIQVAVDKRQLSDLNNLHSQVASGSSNPCNVKDLEPGPCPPGLTKLVALKTQAEDGRAQCVQTSQAARNRLAALKTEAHKANVARLSFKSLPAPQKRTWSPGEGKGLVPAGSWYAR